MKLPEYMTREGIDDEAMAEKVRAHGVNCERTMISRYRRGKMQPSWPMIAALAKASENQVTANDWQPAMEAAE